MVSSIPHLDAINVIGRHVALSGFETHSHRQLTIVQLTRAISSWIVGSSRVTYYPPLDVERLLALGPTRIYVDCRCPN